MRLVVYFSRLEQLNTMLHKSNFSFLGPVSVLFDDGEMACVSLVSKRVSCDVLIDVLSLLF